MACCWLDLFWPCTGLSIVNFAVLGAWLCLANVAYKYLTRPGIKCEAKHVFITGGTLGLGLATAVEYAKRGALVTVVSRKQKNVDAAVEEIAKKVPGAKVQGFPCDISSEESIHNAVAAAQEKFGPIYTLVCCAGTSTPGYFLETGIDAYRRQMELNYIGTVATTKAVVPSMIAAKQGGTIVFVSSAVAFASMIGYSQYAPSKWAVRAFADALRNELIKYDIRIVGYYPTSMDTPGFEVENLTKPQETKDIEGQAGLITPEVAASHLMSGIANGFYSITDDLLLRLGCMASVGLAPREYPVIDFFLLPLVVIIGAIYSNDMDAAAKKGPGKTTA